MAQDVPARAVQMTALTWDIRQGDALILLRVMPSESVHCLVTSPPYWALRAYHAGPQEIGSEPTLKAYLAGLVAVFREAKRVLHRTGVAWVNLGDTYVGASAVEGLQSGDLCRIPDRVATALQQDGWLLRDCIVWAKPAPMPESVRGWRWERHRIVEERGGSNSQSRSKGPTDAGNSGGLLQVLWSDCPGCPKCTPNDGMVLRKGSWRTTRSHEYVFLLAKGPGYFADGEGVREGLAKVSIQRAKYGWTLNGANPHKGQDTGDKPMGNRFVPSDGRNVRSVWEIGPEPLIGEFAGQHFAAYPTELPERCIKAGTSAVGCCPRCLMPWARVVEHEAGSIRGGRFQEITRGYLPSASIRLDGRTSTLGFRPTCACGEAEPIPCIVLDPFSGTGSTGIAAIRNGRSYVGLELSAKYVELSKRRLSVEAPQANSVALACELGRELQLLMEGGDGH